VNAEEAFPSANEKYILVLISNNLVYVNAAGNVVSIAFYTGSSRI